jgi:magnesium-protoporphyrin IX monomethyl ester (oxidative) cyclase
MADVCLVSMPYALIENPSISIGLLKSILKRDGIDASCVYANIQFAQAIGVEIYNSVHRNPMSVFVQEWTFGGVAFPEFHPDHDAFLLRALGPGSSGEALRETAWRLRAAAGGFIDRLAAAIVAQRPKIVGCSSAFAQQVSSLALLRRIREREPGIVTMMGGPNCETEMGLAAHASYTWVDYVVSGEADELISDLCRALLMDRPLLGLLPYGVLGPEDRHSNYSAITNAANGNIPRATTRNFAGLPAPDYSDYFRAIDEANLRTQVHPRLLIETSRGCWWGARKQCTFCGQNTTAAGYRVKSSKQILDEFARLATEYQVRNFQMVDNMIGPTHLQEVLPAMEQMGAPYRVFCESKSTLKRSDVRRLRAAGVNLIRVGIESLDNRILTLLN